MEFVQAEEVYVSDCANSACNKSLCPNDTSAMGVIHSAEATGTVPPDEAIVMMYLHNLSPETGRGLESTKTRVINVVYNVLRPTLSARIRGQPLVDFHSGISGTQQSDFYLSLHQ